MPVTKILDIGTTLPSVKRRVAVWASVRECPLTTTRQINLTIKNDYGKSAD
jgi:hypothetical protein